MKVVALDGCLCAGRVAYVLHGETGDILGKPGMLTGGAQSERPKRRQSGVVDIDGSLRPAMH
jgi:hypothetical protein